MEEVVRTYLKAHELVCMSKSEESHKTLFHCFDEISRVSLVPERFAHYRAVQKDLIWDTQSDSAKAVVEVLLLASLCTFCKVHLTNLGTDSTLDFFDDLTRVSH